MPETVNERANELLNQMRKRIGLCSATKEFWWMLDKIAALELKVERLESESPPVETCEHDTVDSWGVCESCGIGPNEIYNQLYPEEESNENQGKTK